MAYELVVAMLQWDPDKRPTAAEILAHDYFTSEAPKPKKAIELKAIEGDWHELEYKAAKKEREAKDRQSRKDREAKEREARKIEREKLVGVKEVHAELEMGDESRRLHHETQKRKAGEPPNGRENTKIPRIQA
jgi:CTD kinase subunit alpha